MHYQWQRSLLTIPGSWEPAAAPAVSQKAAAAFEYIIETTRYPEIEITTIPRSYHGP